MAFLRLNFFSESDVRKSIHPFIFNADKLFDMKYLGFREIIVSYLNVGENYGIVAATFCEDLIILKKNTRMHMRRWFFVIMFICYLRSIIKRPYLFDIKPRNRYPPHANWLVKYGLLWIASDKITIKGKKIGRHAHIGHAAHIILIIIP